MTLKIRDAVGGFHAVGGMRDDQVDLEPEEGEAVPHLHRMGPDGRYLLTWDALRNRLWIRDMASPLEEAAEAAIGLPAPHAIRVAGLRGKVQTVRWLHDGSGAVFLTPHNAYIARFDASDPSDDTTWAGRVFGRRKTAQPTPLEVRQVPNGLVILAEEGAHHSGGRHAYHVNITDERVGPPVRFSPGVGSVRSLSVRSGGRVVLSVVVDFKHDDGQVDQRVDLQTMRVFANGKARLLSVRECAVEDCDVVNWTPGSNKLVYATSTGEVVIAGRGDREDIVVSVAGEAPFDGVHTLWFDRREARILAAGAESLVMLRASDGEELWSWSPEEDDIVSARFDTDGSVLVSVGRKAFRLRKGKATELFRTRMKAHVGGDDSMVVSRNVFVDDLIPLGNGAIAYSVVRSTVEERWDDDIEDYDYLDEEDEEGWERLP